MSLSEQTARVAGGGKNTLKKILQKLGVTVGDVPIEQYADLADQISDKLNPDKLLSPDVAALFGLSKSATPNDVFSFVANSLGSKAKIVSGSYTGTGTYGTDNPNIIQLGFKYELFFVFCVTSSGLNFLFVGNPKGYLGDYQKSSGIMGQSGKVVSTNDGRAYPTVGFTIFEPEENAAKWYNTVSASGQMNINSETYWYVALGKD